jgi:beta-exotoxin I transport system ATP-binding protein
VTIVEGAEVTKVYGSHRGVDRLSFRVEEGEVYAFLGPNGAGKTTTIRLLLDLIRPTSGMVLLFGTSPRQGVALRRRVGYLPGDLRLYEQLTARQHFELFAGLRGLDALGIAPELATRFDLELDRPLKALSKGNRQKVGIVLAFMHEPELLILDEPTSGLDPLVQQTFNELVTEQREHGRAVFISSHVMSEVQQIADRVALLRDGRLMLEDTVAGLRARAVTRVDVTFAEVPAEGAFAHVAGARELERSGSRVTFALQGEADPFVKAIAAHRVLALESREPDLEDVFISLYEQADA